MSSSSEQTLSPMASAAVPTLEVQIQHNRVECWRYTWDRERAHLRLTDWQPARADLPADLATLRLEQQVEVPVFVFAPLSLAPGTFVIVRLLGAFCPAGVPDGAADRAFPLAGWTLFAMPEFAPQTLSDASPASLSRESEETLRQYLQAEQQGANRDLVRCSAETVAQRLREARVWLKRARRTAPPASLQITRQDEEATVAWRAVEGLTPEQRALVAQAQTVEQVAAFLQPEHLIHSVPLRFQHALERLLLDDERLLAFVQRPRLSHRVGWLRMHQYRANAGLLLITDRQVLWLRDYFSPGASLFPEGFIARSISTERLTDLVLVPAGAATSALSLPLADDSLPYLRLVLIIGSGSGHEVYEVVFPARSESAEALERISAILRTFVPLAGAQERRLRRQPLVEPWIPQGDEVRRLAGLGGVVPGEVKQLLEQRLVAVLQATNEELLVAVTVPALEEYRSPARLVALTRTAVLTCDALPEAPRRFWATPKGWVVQAQRYDLARISSVQLSYSLLGSSLHLWLPGGQGCTQEVIIPFHSPAIAWFLPLFTRLRLLLSQPPPLLAAAAARLSR